jgi:hypothetical protein
LNFLQENRDEHVFPGSAIRLPLRSSVAHELQIIKPKTVNQLLMGFIKGELHDILLFLRNIRTVVILEINEMGNIKELASASLHVLNKDLIGNDLFTAVSISLSTTEKTERIWFKMQTSVTRHYLCSEFLSKRLPMYQDILSDTEKQKLSPEVGIALPADNWGIKGRLFTFLPLPIFTDFPCHLHGIFALTSDRQNLRNRDEVLQSTSVDK